MIKQKTFPEKGKEKAEIKKKKSGIIALTLALTTIFVSCTSPATVAPETGSDQGVVEENYSEIEAESDADGGSFCGSQHVLRTSYPGYMRYRFLFTRLRKQSKWTILFKPKETREEHSSLVSFYGVKAADLL